MVICEQALSTTHSCVCVFFIYQCQQTHTSDVPTASLQYYNVVQHRPNMDNVEHDNIQPNFSASQNWETCKCKKKNFGSKQFRGFPKAFCQGGSGFKPTSVWSQSLFVFLVTKHHCEGPAALMMGSISGVSHQASKHQTVFAEQDPGRPRNSHWPAKSFPSGALKFHSEWSLSFSSPALEIFESMKWLWQHLQSIAKKPLASGPVNPVRTREGSLSEGLD